LQPACTDTGPAWTALRERLERRRGLLDAVVFSGGEPTGQAALRGAVADVREMGFLTGLHTAGIYPRRLARLLPLFDWVGFDVKAEFGGYEVVTGARVSGTNALESLDIVLASGIASEVRTTVHPDLVSPESLLNLARALAQRGVRHYVVQAFRGRGCADQGLTEQRAAGYPDEDLLHDISQLFESFEIRRA
jgi:pyruvate formate lyase activating enzyme